MHWEFENGFFVLKGSNKFDVRVSTRLTPPNLIPDYVGLRQIHSANIHIIESVNDIPDGDKEGDGLITTVRNLTIGVRTADCYPVFIMDERREIAGVLHAGWRGSYKGIVKKGISILLDKFGSSKEDIRVAFGPGICGKCYTVGRDMLDYFPLQFFNRYEERLTLDILAYNVHLLRSMGIDNIVNPPACTYEDGRLYSYRKNRDRSRLISTIRIL